MTAAPRYRLVPMEPTLEMQEAAEKSDRAYTDRVFGKFGTVRQGPYDTYVTMLAASPPPSPEDIDAMAFDMWRAFYADMPQMATRASFDATTETYRERYRRAVRALNGEVQT